MIQIRHSDERGSANHGWLKSQHTFSFADYYDPEFMGVSVLRVINDDKVTPGNGFGTHSHQDMEIISYVKKGIIEHQDSMGNTEKLPAGEFQLMSAGSGVTHSEYNPSTTETLEFLQIWIKPNVYGIRPGYQQKQFKTQQGLQLIASPDGRDASLLLHQNAFLYQLCLLIKQTALFAPESGRTIYVHVVSGALNVGDEQLNEGDGATITEFGKIEFKGIRDCEALVFDLPAN